MDTEALRKKLKKDGEMTPEDWVKMYSNTQPGGPLNPELLDFLELVKQETRRDVAHFIKNKRWRKKSPVVIAYERWLKGERPA